MAEDLSAAVLMFIAQRSAENRILAALRRAGYDDITLAQARVAARIGLGGTRLTVLAEQAQVAKQTASFLVDQLERAGYVERTVDPTDARARLVRIAPRGAEAGHVARAASVRALERSIAAAEEQLPHPAPGRRAGSPRGTPSGTAPTHGGASPAARWPTTTPQPWSRRSVRSGRSDRRPRWHDRQWNRQGWDGHGTVDSGAVDR